MDPIYAIPLAALIFTMGIVIQAAFSMRDRRLANNTRAMQEEITILQRKVQGLEMEIERLKMESREDRTEITRLTRANIEYAQRLAHEGA